MALFAASKSPRVSLVAKGKVHLAYCFSLLLVLNGWNVEIVRLRALSPAIIISHFIQGKKEHDQPASAFIHAIHVSGPAFSPSHVPVILLGSLACRC